MTDLSIAILCGGDSTRFGGDKTRAKIDGIPLYRILWKKLEGKSNDLFLQAAPDDEYDLPKEDDLITEGGPLGGIYSALVHAEHEWLFVSACDLPFLNPGIVDELLLKAEQNTEVVIPRWENGYYEPLTAIYNNSVLLPLEKILEKGTRKITDFLYQLEQVKEVSVERMVEEGKIPRNCFYNINTQQDLEEIDLS